MSSDLTTSSLASRNVSATPGRFGYNGDKSAQTIESGYNGRLAKVLTSVPASALAGAHWATRNKSTSSFSDPTESIGLHHTTRSSVADSTPLALSGVSTGSAQLGHMGTVSFSKSSKDAKGHLSFSSSSVLGGVSESSSDQEQRNLFTPPQAPQPVLNLTSGSLGLELKAGSDKGISSVKSQGSSKLLLSDSSVKRCRLETPSSQISNITPSPVEVSSKSEDIAVQGQGMLQEDAVSPDLMDAEEASQIVMSVCFGQGKLGAAFYDVNNFQVYLVEDKVDASPDFWALHTLLREQKPRWVIVGGRQDVRFFRTLQELCGVPRTPLNPPSAPRPGGSGRENSPSSDVAAASPLTTSSSAASCTIRVLPMSDFKYELCLRRVLSLALPGEPEGATEGERELYIRGKVNTELVQMTRAFGALLRFISRLDCNIFSSIIPEGPLVLGIHIYAMEDLTQLDEETACALQLFSEDQHPANYKSGIYSSSKEGLSVYALLSRTSCPLSPPILRRLLLRPVTDLEVLQSRYALVQWAIDPVNLETVRNIQTSMKKITNVPHVMNRLHQGQLHVRDWKVLYNSLFNAILIGELCHDQDPDIPVFKQTRECVTEGLYHACFLIQRILDIEQSEREARFIVRPGVDTELDEKKRRFSGLSELMQRVAEIELARLPQEVESCSIIYLPHVGYLLAFPPSPELNEILPACDYNLPGLEFMFRTADLILYKSFTCCEMDRELGDIQVDIANHETRIMMRLVESLTQQAQNFTSLVGNILMLDCLLAFATVSREFGWVKPELTTDPVLEMIEARHPLYELCTAAFVANPVRSGPPNPCVTLITGPNASGKTVYLKQVGVLVVLAQIGCFVPATRARLKPVDAIMAVTQATPSVTSTLSAFMADLSRMSNVLDKATRDSLIIIDEFGAATYENDGAALLTACLDYLCQRTVPRYSSPPSREKLNPYSAPPHVFVSTHLLQVYDHLQYKEAVHCLVLDAVEEEGRVVPLYLVTEGRAKTSYAAAVAEVAGIPKTVVDRANRVFKYIRKCRLPPKWSILDDGEERKRCEAVVALLLSHDLEKDPLDELLSKIRKFAQPSTGSTVSSAPSTTAGINSASKAPGSDPSSLTLNASRKNAASNTKVLEPYTEGMSHTPEEMPNTSPDDKDAVLAELSSCISLKLCVETVFSSGSSTSSAREKARDPPPSLNHTSAGSSTVCSNTDKDPTPKNEETTKALKKPTLPKIMKLTPDLQDSQSQANPLTSNSTSLLSDRKRKLPSTPGSLRAPLRPSKSISDAIQGPQECRQDDSKSFSNGGDSSEKDKSEKSRTSLKRHLDVTRRETPKLTSQERESLSGTSCSQESLPLHGSWDPNSAGSRQSLVLHNLGKERKSSFSFQDSFSDTNLATSSTSEKRKGIFSDSSLSPQTSSKDNSELSYNEKTPGRTRLRKPQISKKLELANSKGTVNICFQYQQSPSSLHCSQESILPPKNWMAVGDQEETQGFHISSSTSLSKEIKPTTNIQHSVSSTDNEAETAPSPNTDKTEPVMTSEAPYLKSFFDTPQSPDRC
ncbi:mutS protein homolog 5-like [Macrobrachium nipponense]|uniref:mutS protein homolog 5-like n=1 Tax=Macrobrachium nipponense TaxID=159736 RepID=UPI0030C7A301